MRLPEGPSIVTGKRLWVTNVGYRILWGEGGSEYAKRSHGFEWLDTSWPLSHLSNYGWIWSAYSIRERSRVQSRQPEDVVDDRILCTKGVLSIEYAA